MYEPLSVDSLRSINCLISVDLSTSTFPVLTVVSRLEDVSPNMLKVVLAVVLSSAVGKELELKSNLLHFTGTGTLRFLI